jgi:SNF2 family DNA or RNA helicase
MTDAEFADELATRLNLFLEADALRAGATLTSSLAHVGYANVGHFLGQLCLPRGVDISTDPEELKNVKFLMPVLDEKNGIKAFQTVTGEELQQKHAAMQKQAEEAAKDEPKIH